LAGHQSARHAGALSRGPGAGGRARPYLRDTRRRPGPGRAGAGAPVGGQRPSAAARPAARRAGAGALESSSGARRRELVTRRGGMIGGLWWLLLAGLFVIAIWQRLGALFFFSLLLLLGSAASALWARYCLSGLRYRRALGSSRLDFGAEGE